ncbi:MAG: hypothetical protein ACPGSD_16320 [Flavobacteriales bacterium]
MKSIITLLTLISILFISCDRIKNTTKDTINKGGEAVGETAAEFFEGVSEGIDKTLDCDIIISKDLLNKGLKTGKFTIEDGSEGGTNNQLTLYLIFEKDIDTTLTLKAFDKNKLEIGRTKMKVEGEKGNANYFDFTFDKRTYIEKKSIIRIE